MSGVIEWVEFERAHNTGELGEAWWCVQMGGKVHSMKIPASEHKAKLGVLMKMYCDCLAAMPGSSFIFRKLEGLTTCKGEEKALTEAKNAYKNHRHRSNKPKTTWLGLGNRAAMTEWQERERELREGLDRVTVHWAAEPLMREGPRVWVQFTDPDK